VILPLVDSDDDDEDGGSGSEYEEDPEKTQPDLNWDEEECIDDTAQEEIGETDVDDMPKDQVSKQCISFIRI
jgi:hypothetical protein